MLSLWSPGHVVRSSFGVSYYVNIVKALLGHVSLILFSVLHQLPVCVRYVDLLMRVLSPPSNHGDITRSPHFIIQPVIVHMPTQCTGGQRSSTIKDTSGNYPYSRETQSKKKQI